MAVTVNLIQQGSYFSADSGPFPAGIFTPESCATQCITLNPASVGININLIGNCYCLQTSDFLNSLTTGTEYSTYLINYCVSSNSSNVNSSKGWKISTSVLGIILISVLFFIKFHKIF